MKIAFITTTRHNVGDDFIREGLKYLLKQYFKNQKLAFYNIHKHAPVTSRYGFEWIRSRTFSDRIDSKLPLWITPDKIMESDLVIQSGAPVYWYHKGHTNCVSGNEWYQPLIKRRFKTKKEGKLINMAAGSCQTYHSDGSEFLESNEVCAYIKELHSLSSVTTVRDKLAQDILASLDLNSYLIPCSSIFAVDEYGLQSKEEEYVVVNYMSGGGHFSFNQDIDFGRWQKEFKKFYQVLSKREKIVFSCHNQKEVEEAKSIDPAANIFYSTNFLDYMKFYARGKYGFMNRIHAAYQFSSYGKQSIIIGADTRAKMAQEIGLDSAYVNNVSADMLLNLYEKFENSKKLYKSTIETIKDKAFHDYMIALNSVGLSNVL